MESISYIFLHLQIISFKNYTQTFHIRFPTVRSNYLYSSRTENRIEPFSVLFNSGSVRTAPYPSPALFSRCEMLSRPLNIEFWRPKYGGPHKPNTFFEWWRYRWGSPLVIHTVNRSEPSSENCGAEWSDFFFFHFRFGAVHALIKQLKWSNL